MRAKQVMGTLRTSANKSTSQNKRFVVENECGRGEMVGLRQQARGEDSQCVAELEESLKKLKEEILPWSVEEQEQRRQEDQEQRRKEERERAAMRNAATGVKMTAATTTVVTSATTDAGNKNTDETRKGKGKRQRRIRRTQRKGRQGRQRISAESGDVEG